LQSSCGWCRLRPVRTFPISVIYASTHTLPLGIIIIIQSSHHRCCHTPHLQLHRQRHRPCLVLLQDRQPLQVWNGLRRQPDRRKNLRSLPTESQGRNFLCGSQRQRQWQPICFCFWNRSPRGHFWHRKRTRVRRYWRGCRCSPLRWYDYPLKKVKNVFCTR